MGPYQVLRGVVREKGIAGLWRGSAMSMTRSAVLTASQCATYDEVKKATKTYTGMRDGVLLHFTASMLAGLVTTTATNPRLVPCITSAAHSMPPSPPPLVPFPPPTPR